MKQHTLTVEISDAAIRRHALDPAVRELKDPRLPIRLRYDRHRTGGSWHVVRYAQGKAIWRKAGAFPALTSKALKTALPKILANLAGDPTHAATVGTYDTLNDLLVWYESRMAADRGLSQKRKATVRSAIKCHLRPKLGALQLVELSKHNIDTQLVWPLQGACSLAHTRLVFGVLKVICKKAQRLQLIEVNPVAGILFSDFVSTKILAKAMRIRGETIPALLDSLAQRFDQEPGESMLVLMMLAHGTRIGETRQARWVDLAGPWWHLPGHVTKTREALNLPITEPVRALLQRYRALQADRGYAGAYLFPGRRSGRPLTERAASEVFSKIGAGEWTSHDLRKLARTTWLDLGVDTMTGELLLNHKLKDLNSAYIHTEAQGRKRDALERWHTWLDERGFTALHAKTGPR